MSSSGGVTTTNEIITLISLFFHTEVAQRKLTYKELPSSSLLANAYAYTHAHMVASVVVVDVVVVDEVEERGDVMTVATGSVRSKATSAVAAAAGDGGAPVLSPALTSRHLQCAYMRSTTKSASEAWYHQR